MKPLFVCTSLVEVDLSNNAILRVEGLDGCLSLRRLDLSRNKIARLNDSGSSLPTLTGLQELLLEGNAVTSVAELSALKPLTELTRGDAWIGLSDAEKERCALNPYWVSLSLSSVVIGSLVCMSQAILLYAV